MIDREPVETSIYHRTFEQWIESIEGENAQAVKRFMEDSDHGNRLLWAPGSRGAHHAWEGGYAEHLRQTMMIVAHDFEIFTHTGRLGELTELEQFTLSDALTVLFLHDIEKPFIYDFDEQGNVLKRVEMNKAERKVFQRSVINQYGFALTPTMENALRHVEGVRDEHYIPGERVDHPLAALCHAADNLSARGFYDHKG